VSKVVGMSALSLSKLTSSFSVILKEDRLNLGLNLKFEGKRQKVLGYTRRSQAGWEYSDKAVALLQAYKKKFPEFIAGLERFARKENVHAEDFYRDGEQAKLKMKEIRDWLKSVEVKSFERVPVEAQELDAATIAEIEAAANAVNTSTASEVVGKTVKGVPRIALLRPEDAAHRLSTQVFSLGDRVTYVADTGKVPITTRGTCVGVHKDSLDIVFDVAFMSGTVLGGRCSEYRGMTVDYASVLNYTDPSVLTVSKAQQGRQHPALGGQQQHARGGVHHHGQRGGPNGSHRGGPPVRLLARNAAVPGQQYYSGPQSPRNGQANVWQSRVDSQFLGSMMQQGANATNGAGVGAGNWQQQHAMHTAANGSTRGRGSSRGQKPRGHGSGRGGHRHGAAPATDAQL
jgi:5'-3' exoribonuclease 1